LAPKPAFAKTASMRPKRSSVAPAAASTSSHSATWDSLGAEEALALGAQRVAVERFEGAVGDENLVARGVLGDAGGDVDVDAEVVAPQPAGPADVDAGADLGVIAVGLDSAETLAGLVDCGEGVRRVGEDGHHSVAQALHDLAAVLAHWGLNCLGDVAQEREGRVVAGLHRPVREVDEVGEDDCEVALAAPATRVL
jgi:hypothetical protein